MALTTPFTANFSYDKMSGITPLTVQFTDETGYALSGVSGVYPNKWAWYFGDGEVSNSRNPKHQYKMDGDYSVKLVVGNTGVNEYDEKVEENAIYVYEDDFNRYAKDLSYTNTSYKFGIKPTNGIGFSENGSTYPMPSTRCGNLKLIDDYGYAHNIVLDTVDKKFYDINIYDGPSGTNQFAVWQDKTNISGVSGLDYTPTVGFGKERGEQERFFVKKVSDKINVKPYRQAYIDADGYDEHGFPDGLTFDASIYSDSDPITAKVTAQDIEFPNHEIVYDRVVDNTDTVQAELVANKAPFRIYSKQSNLIVNDKQDSPNNKLSTEDTLQLDLSDPLFWITRTTDLTDRVSGDTIDIDYSNVSGPDGRSDSALSTTESFTVSGLTNPSFLTMWHKDGYSISGVSFTEHDTQDDWILSKASNIPSTL